MIKIIYYVHGTTLDNINKVCSGWNDVDLSERGFEEAKRLGVNASYDFDVLFTSDLVRAEETAKLAFPSFESTSDKRLRECNYGDYDGEDKKLVVYEKHIIEPFPNGESLKDVEARIRDFLKYISENFKGKKVGIIAHRAPQLAIEVITKHISWEDANSNDWRKTGDWQPGWEYVLKDRDL